MFRNHSISINSDYLPGTVLCLVSILISLNVCANNISVSHVTLTNQNSASQTTSVQFDVGWENSWRSGNWDAAWIFVKYRNLTTGGARSHATLSQVASDHTAPAGSTIKPAADGTGVFIYRDATGTGTVNFAGVQLRWNYGVDGLADSVNVDIDVFAIEMVLVKQGAFSAGSGGSETGAFTQTTITTADATVAGGFPSGETAPENASWPNGFDAFYCMKYEISQGQYADFLNSLTATQAVPHFWIGNRNRYTITGIHPNISATSPDIACSFLDWDDGIAYSDWSGLRPMTELEYEKACRGTIAPVTNEYAWGTTAIHFAIYTLTNSGTATESISNPGIGATGNALYSATHNNQTDPPINGPFRCGIFAASAVGAERDDSGGSFYGIMEMSGNLWESAVTIGFNGGRIYTGLHGDGNLTVDGLANVLNWPKHRDFSADGAGWCFRGGAWNTGTDELRISDRNQTAAGPNNNPNNPEFHYIPEVSSTSMGFRCVRSRPAP